MIKYHTSKSYCEQLSHHEPTICSLLRHQSISLCHKHKLVEYQETNSPQSYCSSLTQDDLFTLIQSEHVANKPVRLLSKKHDLTDIIVKYGSVRTHAKKKPNKKLKPKKNCATKELVKFVIRKESSNFNKAIEVINKPSEHVALEANEPFVIDPFEAYEHEDFTCSTLHDDYLTTRSNFFEYSDVVRKYLRNMNVIDLADEPKQKKFGCLRLKRSNKTIKLKFLLRNQNVLSACKNIEHTTNSILSFSKNSIHKGNVKVHVKYHVYKKLKPLFDMFVYKKDRANHVFAIKNSSYGTLSKETINNNINFHRELAKADKNNKRQKDDANVDIQVVVNNSIEHGRMNNELTKTYDEIYLEFLISLQHRDITPEDYEYLSRLDELIKKKTVNDELLNLLTVEIVTESNIGNESCGICLDTYSVGDSRKQLPCWHKFHSDCIDQWLREQSTDCPLDKIPIDQKSIEHFKNRIEVDTNVQSCLKEIIDTVETTFIAQECLDQIILSIKDEASVLS